MNGLRRFGAFWYHFIVGDDWRIAAGVVLGLGTTAWLVRRIHVRAWWFLPIAVVTMLTLSLWMAIRPSSPRR
jgi:hypothetical protein